ncbi:hypothetical protein GN244_ATG10441 [Phytophthora infestans]|uniref:Uncharacterized protein n=1 Tax=Phytophthora infestans TaxID=4787 RepID=A0A833W0V8_PHYIN|nr:hypothetical protein GN244_ATG10441 [Phytophthora infestans]
MPLFQNRWFSDHEQRISQQDVAVVSGRTAYDLNTLKAMPTWHTAVSHFDIIDEATNGWKIWITLNGNHSVDVLGEYFWATSLRGKTMIEGPCLDTAVTAIVKRNSDKIIVFSIPSDVLRFPILTSNP